MIIALVIKETAILGRKWVAEIITSAPAQKLVPSGQLHEIEASVVRVVVPPDVAAVDRVPLEAVALRRVLRRPGVDYMNQSSVAIYGQNFKTFHIKMIKNDFNAFHCH
jgi:hypothetical protein